MAIYAGIGRWDKKTHVAGLDQQTKQLTDEQSCRPPWMQAGFT